MILHDKAIRDLCQSIDYNYIKHKPIAMNEYPHEFEYFITGNNEPMINPFIGYQTKIDVKGNPCISYGLSSMGYDVRLSDQIKLFTNVNARVIDPMEHDDQSFIVAQIRHDDDGKRYFVLPPNGYALGHTLETFSIPREVMVMCLGKSTYARSSVLVNVTPIEPGFKGQVVIELANGCSSPVKVYIDGGIAQFVFMKGIDPCEISYADRAGKYQNQTGIEHAKF